MLELSGEFLANGPGNKVAEKVSRISAHNEGDYIHANVEATML